MNKKCLNCGRIMKEPELTHCSDECMFKQVKKSKSKRKNGTGIEFWKEKSDPWK